MPITAHLGSVATIFTVYFFRSGSISFNTSSVVDWGISAILAFVVVSGVYVAISELRRSSRVIIERDELTKLLAVARIDAEISAESLAGDLSWLEEEAPALCTVEKRTRRSQSPCIMVRDRVSMIHQSPNR